MTRVKVDKSSVKKDGHPGWPSISVRALSLYKEPIELIYGWNGDPKTPALIEYFSGPKYIPETTTGKSYSKSWTEEKLPKIYKDVWAYLKEIHANYYH